MGGSPLPAKPIGLSQALSWMPWRTISCGERTTTHKRHGSIEEVCSHGRTSGGFCGNFCIGTYGVVESSIPCSRHLENYLNEKSSSGSSVCSPVAKTETFVSSLHTQACRHRMLSIGDTAAISATSTPDRFHCHKMVIRKTVPTPVSRSRRTAIARTRNTKERSIPADVQ